MGFFSSLWEGVKSVASSVWEGAKKVAKTVVNTAVEWGGKIVGSVKKVYNAVKPYLQPIKKAVLAATAKISTVFPWAATVGTVIAKGLDWLDKIGNSPLAKKVGKAIEWALEKAKFIKETFFNKEEENQAVTRQKDLHEAMGFMQTEEQRRSIRFAQLINEYILVRTRIQEALDSFEISNSNNFDHYLRLRATQKLLKITERRLEKAQDLSEISHDDLFLIETGNKLLETNPYLTEEETIRLDKLIQQRYGKALLPFVFEELIFSWNINLEDMQDKWNKLNTELSKLQRELTQLQVKKKIEDLSATEQQRFNYLNEEVKELGADLREQAGKNRTMQDYIYAAEGFLQVLEKTEQQWIDEDREWVLEESEEVGMLLIECVEGKRSWDSLTDEQQSLISDFANVFMEDSKRRTKEVANEEIEVA
ncbi:hypothetical protein L4G92_06390 [Neisseria sp. ZJ106]|uniref:Uncharacterized protein n=1 Tax=Neisseria lisongii TaxID=2912188 RepID=A0ABY7RL56_9NEIS|nr:hypothetical protein [Neisseria lisongii]MCF7521675.1 hypothetical protein [Neisseria lisongii]WCL72238.1 hypothetical protein PJU73_03800 [Neisseria lisongii]